MIFLEMICMVSFADGVWTRRKASQATSANLVRCSCGYFENVYDSFFEPVYGHTETTRKEKSLKCNGRRDDMSSFRFVMVKLGYIEQHIIFKFIFLRRI